MNKLSQYEYTNTLSGRYRWESNIVLQEKAVEATKQTTDDLIPTGIACLLRRPK
jgi:hypothetical protein